MKHQEKGFGLIITNKCDLNCKYCFRKNDKSASSDISLTILNHVINIASKRGYKEVQLTGGDPFLHPELLTILDLAIKSGIDVFIETNGMNVSSDVMNEILAITGKKHLKMMISLDSSRKENHEYLRGLGSFEKAIQAIKLLHSLKVPFYLKRVVNNLNPLGIKDLEEFIGFCSMFSPQYLFLTRVVPVSNEQKIRKLTLNKQELMNGRLLLMENKSKYAFLKYASHFWKYGTLDICPRLKTNTFYLMPDGRISPCLYMPKITIGTWEELEYILDDNILLKFNSFRKDSIKSFYDRSLFSCAECSSVCYSAWQTMHAK